jgi:tryptophanyl-tRNA synthetase
MDNKEIVLSGIRATGRLHLGNYLGAIRNFVALSNDPGKKCFFFIANLHTLTTRIDPGEIDRDLKEIVLSYLACGINLENSVIFSQSSVPETCELSWLLSCLSPIGDLTRMPHFKEKGAKLEQVKDQSVNAGLLTYPILMAADILGPCANLVPVGEDQLPHLEFAAELAKRFNHRFGELFPVPNKIDQEDIRVPGLDGSGKMGKSDNNTIDLYDSADEIWKKLKPAKTDPARKLRTDPGDPNICNIYTLHNLLSTDKQLVRVYKGCRNAEIGCIDCKKILYKNIDAVLKPIRERYTELKINNPDQLVRSILMRGGNIARAKIAPVVNQAKQKMGVPSY